jgi:predicted aconitase with swiveling domain
VVVTARVIVPGTAAGPLLRVGEPLSFWGGVDPQTGRITDPRCAAHGRSVAGTVLALRRTCGSSSSSSVMLELLHRGVAPAALLMQEVDAILVLGVLVAAEMGWPTIPVLALPWDAHAALDGTDVVVREGWIEAAGRGECLGAQRD